MEQRVSLITLGCRDVEKSAAFYDALGWARAASEGAIVAYDLLGQTLGLYPLLDLARDMGLDLDEIGHGASTLSCNVRSKDEVASVLTQASAAGGRILKPPHDVFWGGHIGYFADPDGHIWEVAFNPFSKLRQDGAFCWGGYE